VLGHRSALEAKDRIGYLPEERGLYRRMRVGGFLAYLARLKGVEEARLPDRVAADLARVGLPDIARMRCDELSKGMSQKVQFVAATLHRPDLLILDEPFEGLDPISMRLLRDLLFAEQQRGATVLLSTHVMPQAEEICDRVVMLHRGRKVLDETLTSIRQRYDPRAVKLEPLDPRADLTPLRALPGVERVDAATSGYEVLLEAGTDPIEAMRRMLDTVPSARLELARPRLEDVFVQLVSDAVPTASRDESRATPRGSAAGGPTA